MCVFSKQFLACADLFLSVTETVTNATEVPMLVDSAKANVAMLYRHIRRECGSEHHLVRMWEPFLVVKIVQLERGERRQ